MLTCKKAFEARDCISCKNCPANQLGKPAGSPISPSVKSSGQCSAYAGIPANQPRAAHG